MRRLSVALVALMATGCGYHLSGRGPGPVPDTVRSIAVLPFENRTDRPEIEQRVTEEVARELARRGRYKVISDSASADAILEGAVTGYRATAVEFTASGRSSRDEASVTIQATLRLRADDSVLWSQSGLVFKEQFDVSQSGEFFDQETVAFDSIARGAAGALITSMLEGF